MTAIRTIDDHLELANIGTNSHTQIDTHIAAADDYVKRDGSLALTADWDIGDTRKLHTDEIRARDAAGLKLYDDAGNGMFVEDGGDVGIGTESPAAKLDIFGSGSGAPSVHIKGGTGISYIEFSRHGYTPKGAIGALGGFEMNFSHNMDYSDGTHQYYDSTENAYWLTMQTNGMYLQYAPSGMSVADIWYAAGKVPFAVLDGRNVIVGTDGTSVTNTGESLQVVQHILLRNGSFTHKGTAQIQYRMVSANNQSCAIYFGDSGSTYRGLIKYDNNGDYMAIHVAASEAIRIINGGNVGINTTTPTAKLDVNSDKIRLRTAKTPASITATGSQGDVCWDAGFMYVCVATNTWRRAALLTW